MSDFTVYWSVRSRRLAIIKIWFKMCLLSVLLCSKMLLCYRHTVKKINHFYDLIMMIYNIQTFYLMFIFYRIYWCSMWARKSNCGPINFEKLGVIMAPKVSIVNHNPVLHRNIQLQELSLCSLNILNHKSKVSLCKPIVCWNNSIYYCL